MRKSVCVACVREWVCAGVWVCVCVDVCMCGSCVHICASFAPVCGLNMYGPTGSAAQTGARLFSHEFKSASTFSICII